jgi:hypothetical protein
MTSAIILIIVAVITLLSLLLKFSNLAKENASIFLDIKKRNSEIRQMISELKIDDDNSPTYKRFWLSISDWFSGLAILLISFRLIMEYVSTEYMTRATVFHIGLFFSLLLFNLIFLSISIMERRLGYWIDEFMNIIGHIIELIRMKEAKEESVKPTNISTRLRSTKKKRITRSIKNK